jgi:hypothetical protein
MPTISIIQLLACADSRMAALTVNAVLIPLLFLRFHSKPTIMPSVRFPQKPKHFFLSALPLETAD